MKRFKREAGSQKAEVSRCILALLMGLCRVCSAQHVELVPVISKPLFQRIDLPGELTAFQSVELHAKVRGYVERMLVDRGSVVKRGQLLATIGAPEMKAQIAEANSRVSAAEADRLQAEAQRVAAQSTYEKLKKAAETPGAISGNELEVAEQQVKVAEAMVQSKQQARTAAEDALHAQQELQMYLTITAPFSGVITQRLVHPGALVGPGSDPVLLMLEDVAHLRLVVPVPEQNSGAVAKGTRVDFHIPAMPQRSYTGVIARISPALDPTTRTMAVELDVNNRDGSLAPGMYPSVKWPVHRLQASLLVPKTSVVTTTERTFVVRVRNGKTEWVNVSKGVADGDLIEVSGNLVVGDRVVRRATDEMHDGAVIE